MIIDAPTEKELSEIRRQLRFEIPQTYFAKRKKIPAKPPLTFYSLTERKARVPLLFGSALRGVVPNQGKPSYPFNFTGKLLERQVPVCQEATEHMTNYGTAILNLYTSFGKTVVGSFLSSQRGLRTLILCPGKILGPQWTETFRSFTDAKVFVVEKRGISPTDEQVIVCLATRIDYLSPEVLETIGCLILDEADRLCTPKGIPALLATCPSYVLVETATLERPDKLHEMLFMMAGKHTFIKRISDKPFRVVALDTELYFETPRNEKGETDWDAMVKEIQANEERNDIIVKVVEAFPESKILILTSEKSHVQYLHERISSIEPCDFLMGNKKGYQDTRVLIGTVSKLGRGFDEKAFCPDIGGDRIDLLIMCSSYRSVTVIEQTTGRAFRSNFPQVVHLRDNNSILEGHWKVACKWYKSRKGEIEYKTLKQL